MTTNAADGLRLITDAKGRLLLVEWLGGRTDHETRWLCLGTTGHRDLVVYDGTCVHDGASTRDAQVVRAVRRTVATMRPSQTEGPVLAAAVRLLLDRPPAEEPDHDRILADLVRMRFREACGEATVHAVMSGIAPERLERIDGEAGAKAVDAAARETPFLAPLIAAGSHAARSIEIWHVLQAVKAREEGAVAQAAWRLAWHLYELIPNGGDPYRRLDDYDGFEDFDRDPEDDPELGVDRLPPPPVPDNVRLLLDRLRGVSLPWPLAVCAIIGCAHVPADWLPRGREAARDFAVCAYLAERMARHSRGALQQRELLAASRGRWAGFARRATASTSLGDLIEESDPLRPWIDYGGKGVACRGSQEVEALARMLGDMVERFRKQVAIPAAALRRAHVPVGEPAEVPRQAVWRLLLGGKSLPAAMEAVHRWHARRDAMDRIVRTIGDRRIWPRPFPDFVASNGVAVTPLLDAKALAEEGARLRHCVADYADGCARERSVIVSLRPQAGDAPGSTAELKWIPLASVAIRQGWAPAILQHRTTLNGTPSEAEVAALRELVAWLGSGEAWPDMDASAILRPDWTAPWAERIDRLARRIARGPAHFWLLDAQADEGDQGEGHDQVSQGCGYDWRRPEQLDTAIDAWAPFLPRDARGGITALSGPLGLAPWPEYAMPDRDGAQSAGVRQRSSWFRPGPLAQATGRLAWACFSFRWLRRQNFNEVILWILGAVLFAFLVFVLRSAYLDFWAEPPGNGTDVGRSTAPIVEAPSAADAEMRRIAIASEQEVWLDMQDRIARYLAMPASPCPAGALPKTLALPALQPTDAFCHGAGRIRVSAYGGTIKVAYVPDGLPAVVVAEASSRQVAWISDGWRERTLATMAAEGVPARPAEERVTFSISAGSVRQQRFHTESETGRENLK